MSGAALSELNSWWFFIAALLVVSVSAAVIAWRRRETPEQAWEQVQQRHKDPLVDTAGAPLHPPLLSFFRSGQWRASPSVITASWYNEELRYREQGGILRTQEAHPPRAGQREVMLLDRSEWVRTHVHEPGAPSPIDREHHLVTSTRDSRLPENFRWNVHGPNPVEHPTHEAQGDRARTLLMDTDKQLRRATALWRWAYRLTATASILSLVLIAVGGAVDEDLRTAGVLSLVLLLPSLIVLRWGRIAALRRRGERLLSAQGEEQRAAAWVNREVLAQWRAGGDEFWEYAPALPPAMLWSWKKDPRWPVTLLFGILGVVGVILAGISLFMLPDWIQGSTDFPAGMIIAAGVLLGFAVGAQRLRGRRRDAAQMGELMDTLRHGEGLPEPSGISAWTLPQTRRRLLKERHEDIHHQVSELHEISRNRYGRREDE